MDNQIEKSVYLKATPEQVWAYLTEPDRLETWFHRSQGSLEEGKSYKMGKWARLMKVNV